MAKPGKNSTLSVDKQVFSGELSQEDIPKLMALQYNREGLIGAYQELDALDKKAYKFLQSDKVGLAFARGEFKRWTQEKRNNLKEVLSISKYSKRAAKKRRHALELLVDPGALEGQKIWSFYFLELGKSRVVGMEVILREISFRTVEQRIYHEAPNHLVDRKINMYREYLDLLLRSWVRSETFNIEKPVPFELLESAYDNMMREFSEKSVDYTHQEAWRQAQEARSSSIDIT